MNMTLPTTEDQISFRQLIVKSLEQLSNNQEKNVDSINELKIEVARIKDKVESDIESGKERERRISEILTRLEAINQIREENKQLREENKQLILVVDELKTRMTTIEVKAAMYGAGAGFAITTIVGVVLKLLNIL